MSHNSSRWGIWAGVALIGLGMFFLLDQFLPVAIMGFLWPLIILAGGAAFFFGMFAGGRALGALAIPGSIITTIGLILFIQNLFGLWYTWSYAWALIISGVGVGLVIFGNWSDLPDLRRAGRVVISVGLVLFFVFGLFFTMIASLSGIHNSGGVLWAVLLILVGVYMIFGRTFLGRWTETGPVSRSTVDISAPAQSSKSVSIPIENGVIAGVRRVRFRSLGDMVIRQADHEGLEIEASPVMKERIRANVSGDLLEIRYDANWLEWADPRFWNMATPVRYTLYLRNLEMIDAGGLGNLSVSSLVTRRLSVIHGGMGNIDIRDLEVAELEVTQAGMGNVEISGRAESQTVALTGAGSYQADRLECCKTQVRLSGLGSAKVFASESLDALVSGAGSVTYYGNPQVTERVTGLGSIKRLGNHKF